MKIKLITQYASMACVFIGAYATDAEAQTIDYNGSDTLQIVTERLIATGTCGDVNYLGEGSSAGEQDLCDDLQKTTPMSRPLKKSKVCSTEPEFDCAASVDDDLVKGQVVAVDHLAISRRQSTENGCTNLAEVGTWQETLRTIYGGKDGLGQANANSCEHADRVNFANNWDALFSDCAAGAENCNGLSHALRRDDNSGTTDVFKSVLGITNFCNGSADGLENEDNDPLRVSCDSFTSTERYCRKDGPNSGTLGLVLAISVPSGSGKPAAWIAATRNNNACLPGSFDFKLHFDPYNPTSTECPYGGAKVGGQQCLFPKDAAGDFGCNNNRFNRPAVASPTFDGRSYNTQHRLASGAPIVDRIRNFHRLSAGCSESSSTDQIGCIVGSQNCYIGYGGVEQLNAPDTQGINILAKSPTDAPTPGGDAYPFFRKLYFNTLNNFNATNAEEQKLVACYQDAAKVNAAIDGLFFPAQDFGAVEDTCQ